MKPASLVECVLQPSPVIAINRTLKADILQHINSYIRKHNQVFADHIASHPQEQWRPRLERLQRCVRAALFHDADVKQEAVKRRLEGLEAMTEKACHGAAKPECGAWRRERDAERGRFGDVDEEARTREHGLTALYTQFRHAPFSMVALALTPVDDIMADPLSVGTFASLETLLLETLLWMYGPYRTSRAKGWLGDLYAAAQHSTHGFVKWLKTAFHLEVYEEPSVFFRYMPMSPVGLPEVSRECYVSRSLFNTMTFHKELPRYWQAMLSIWEWMTVAAARECASMCMYVWSNHSDKEVFKSQQVEHFVHLVQAIFFRRHVEAQGDEETTKLVKHAAELLPVLVHTYQGWVHTMERSRTAYMYVPMEWSLLSLHKGGGDEKLVMDLMDGSPQGDAFPTSVRLLFMKEAGRLFHTIAARAHWPVSLPSEFVESAKEATCPFMEEGMPFCFLFHHYAAIMDAALVEYVPDVRERMRLIRKLQDPSSRGSKKSNKHGLYDLLRVSSRMRCSELPPTLLGKNRLLLDMSFLLLAHESHNNMLAEVNTSFWKPFIEKEKLHPEIKALERLPVNARMEALLARVEPSVKVVERVVEKRVEVPVERIVEKPKPLPAPAPVVVRKSKECPPGKERNPKTGRCKKATASKGDCPPGKERNAKTGRCKKVEGDKEPKQKKGPKRVPKKDCPPGKVRNPKTKRCGKA